MPIYVYETLPEPGEEPTRFEIMHSIHEPALTHHPTTGAPVRRVIMPVNVLRRHSSGQEKQLLSDRNVASKGFTRYEKAGDGVWERTAGKDGPRRLHRPED